MSKRHDRMTCPHCEYEGRPVRAQRRVGKGTVLVCPACHADPRDPTPVVPLADR